MAFQWNQSVLGQSWPTASQDAAGGALLPGKISNLPTTTTLTNLQLIPAYKDQPHQQTPATTR
jgi:hypothetical protein